MSFVNIPIGRTQDTVDFRIGKVPEVNSLDLKGPVVNQTTGFLTNPRVVANFEIAHLKDNLLHSLEKGHYLFTIKGSSRKATTLLNLPLLNYVLATMQKDKNIDALWVRQNVNPVGVLISEDSEWKNEPVRNKYLRQRHVALGVSGMVTDIYNIWGKSVKTGNRLYFDVHECDPNSSDKKGHVYNFGNNSSDVKVDAAKKIFQVVPSVEEESKNFRWYVGKAALEARKTDEEELKVFSNTVAHINSSSKIECFLDF